MKQIVINCQLVYDLPRDNMTEEEIIEFAENVELPKEYNTGTFELYGVWDEDKMQYEICF